jgi:hypothetical protein
LARRLSKLVEIVVGTRASCVQTWGTAAKSDAKIFVVETWSPRTVVAVLDRTHRDASMAVDALGLVYIDDSGKVLFSSKIISLILD